MKIEVNSLYKLAAILIGGSLILGSFSFAATQQTVPETLKEIQETEGAKKLGEQARKAEEAAPNIIKKIWEEDTLPILKMIWNWLKKIWEEKIVPLFYKLIGKPLKKEIEERKPEVKKEFEKEKEELKQEIPEITESIWERFKELFK